MSCKTETKYLTIKFLYSSRILNIQTGIIVCTSDKIKKIYNEITSKLLINHKDKDHKKFFHLFCNSKLCSNMMNKSFIDIFGITPYVINIILRREFFDINNLIKKPTKISEDVKKMVYRKIKTIASKSKLQEISSYEFINGLEKNNSIDFKKETNYKLFKLFLKLNLREDIILIELLNKFGKSKLSNDLNIVTDFGNLIELVKAELSSSDVIKRPIILYYQSLFSVEQLKSVLTTDSKNTINDYLTGVEKFGIETSHPGCLAEQELRNILIDPKKTEIFMNFIEESEYSELLNNLAVYQKYLILKKTLPVHDLISTKKITNFKEIVKTPIIIQSGGDISKFNNLVRLLEINGEPRHDFGKGERAEHLPDSIERSFFGKDTGESPEFTQLKRNTTADLGIDKDSGLFLGNHESKYFLNFYKNTDYHISSDIKNINSRYRFFRFKSESNLDMNVFNDDVIGISQYISNSDTVPGITFLKTILLENNIKHFLFDTSASISGTTCFKECFSGVFSYCERSGETTREKELNNKLCNLDGMDNITEIVPIVKFWDPASADPKKFIDLVKEFNESSDADDTEYIKMLTSLFMSDNPISTEVLLIDDDNIWTPKRKNLSGFYQVKINPKVIEDIKTGSKPDENLLIIKLKNVEEDIKLKEGLSVYKLSVMINILMDKTMTRAKLDGIFRGSKDPFKLKTKSNYNEFVSILTYFFTAIKDKVLTRKEALRILLDMKKSGDWSLIKWVQINNKYYTDKHKTVLFTGDILCGLFSIVNGLPTLFGTLAIENNNPFYFTNNLGDIQFIENRTLAYYSGSDKIFSYGDFTQKCEYIADRLFDVGAERDSEGLPSSVADLTDNEINWDETDLEQIKARLPNIISELEKTPESLDLLFSGKHSIIGNLQTPIIEYEKMTSEERKTNTQDIVSSLNNLTIIVNIFSKLEGLGTHNYFLNAHLLTNRVYNLMVDFTTTYTYVGTDKYMTDPTKIFIPTEVQEELKSKLRNITGNSSAPSSFETEHTQAVIGSSSRNNAFDIFKTYRAEINTNLFGLLEDHRTDEIDEVCLHILDLWGGISDPKNKKIRMGHFVRDLSVLLKTLMKVRSFLDIFDIFPSIIHQINEDIELIDLGDATSSNALKDILNNLKTIFITQALGKNEEAIEILNYVIMIKRIYNCFSELLEDIGKLDNNQIADLSEVKRQDQQESFIDACELIDSLNSNLQLYFGYLDITPPAAAGAAEATGADES